MKLVPVAFGIVGSKARPLFNAYSLEHIPLTGAILVVKNHFEEQSVEEQNTVH